MPGHTHIMTLSIDVSDCPCLEDVIKTRVQTQVFPSAAEPRRISDRSTLLPASETSRRSSALEITRQMYEREGVGVFFRGLGVCTARAFFVNAVQVWKMLFPSDDTDMLTMPVGRI